MTPEDQLKYFFITGRRYFTINDTIISDKCLDMLIQESFQNPAYVDDPAEGSNET